MSFAAANLARTRQAVAGRFLTLLDRLEPTPTELAAYTRHKASVDGALGLVSVRIGSMGRGTAIRGASDLDLLAKLSREAVATGGRLESSDRVLRRLRGQLNATFALTEVRRDQVAVVVQFGKGDRAVDVVPAVFDRMVIVDGVGTMRPRFLIPNGDGRWQQTSPGAHDAYIAQADLISGYKLKRVARMLKFWRGCRSPAVPLQSFHAELVLAATGACVGAKSYAECMLDAFAALAARGGRGLQDPLSISGIIPAASTRRGAELCHQSVLHSLDHGRRAVMAEHAGNFQEAARQWGIVFNGSFPR